MIDTSTYNKTILANGIRVVTESVPHAHSAAIGVWIDAGTVDEPNGQEGIAHFIEHMVFKGTKQRSIRDIAQSLESVGGYLNAFTSKEQTCYYARVQRAHAERALDVLADIALHATFPGEEIRKEQQVIVEEMRSAEDEPEEFIHDQFEAMLFKGHPLGRMIVGTEGSIRSITKRQLRDFIRERYVASRLVVAVAGAIDHASVVGWVEKYFSSTPTTRSVRSSRSIPAERPNEHILRKPIHQSHICVGVRTQAARHEARFVLSLLNVIVGDGMSSRLFQSIREVHGLAYAVYSSISLFKQAGVFTIYAGTDAEQSDRCLALINRELRKLRAAPPSRREIERAKQQLKGSILLGNESLTNRMNALARSELVFGKRETLEHVLARIDALTRDDLAEACDDVCDSDRFTRVVIAPE